MNQTLVLQLLGSLAFVTLVTTIVQGVMNRKRLGAEATKIITDAASGVVASVREDNERLRNRLTELERREDEWRYERNEWLAILRSHQSWDITAVAAVQKAIPPVHLPDPPPLTPPYQRKRTSNDPRD